MSDENVEIVRKQIDASNAFMRGELTREVAEELVDPQIQVHGSTNGRWLSSHGISTELRR